MFLAIRQAFIRHIETGRIVFQDSEEQNRFLNYSVCCTAGLPLMFFFCICNLLLGKIILSSVIFTSLAGLGIGWYLAYRGISITAILRANIALFFILLIYMAYIGGQDGSKLLWMYIFPLIACSLGHREGMVWNTLIFTCSLFIMINPYNWANSYYYPTDYIIRFLLSYVIVSTMAYFYERFRQQHRSEIEHKNNLLQLEIAKRQQVAEALKKSEEKYRAIYTEATDGILIINGQGIILESNPQMNSMLGYSDQHLIGTNLMDLVHPADLEAKPSQIPQILAGQSILLERRMRTADGVYRLFELSGKMIEDNCISLIYRDITDKKNAEIALEKANKELDRLANIDGLTQVANRRKFETTIQQEWQRLSREKLPLSLILCDIDYFKQYNDFYGHQKGDGCLITIAKTLDETLQRPADLLARYGGEEFIILLPNTHVSGSLALAEEMRQRVLFKHIPHKGSHCSTYVTVSFGVASMTPGKGNRVEDLITRADKALYIAKQNGRNRVETEDSMVLVRN